MIPESDLEALKSFDSHGNTTLSVYLRLDTPEHREGAYDEFMKQMQSRLEESGLSSDSREAIKEDMEIVGIYLRTNGHRQHAGLVIFSCAAELFWRAYPLSVPLSTQVTVGSAFNIEPLAEVVDL